MIVEEVEIRKKNTKRDWLRTLDFTDPNYKIVELELYQDIIAVTISFVFQPSINTDL